MLEPGRQRYLEPTLPPDTEGDTSGDLHHSLSELSVPSSGVTGFAWSDGLCQATEPRLLRNQLLFGVSACVSDASRSPGGGQVLGKR